MSANGKKAHNALLSFAPLTRYGYCWYYVWKAYASAGATTNQGSTPTAYAAWGQTTGKHQGDMTPPPGAAVWLGKRFSDGNMDGDVFIAGEYDGDHAATDYPSWGKVGLCTLRERINQTGREYLGWSDHILDCPIDLGNSTPTDNGNKPSNETDDDMKIFQTPSNQTFFFATSRGIVAIANPDHLSLLRRFLSSKPGAEESFTPGERDVINDYLTKPVLSWADLNS